MKLSPRQIEVALLIADDLTDREIARILAISPKTVQAHLDRILRKIQTEDSTRTRRRLIRRWIEDNPAEM